MVGGRDEGGREAGELVSQIADVAGLGRLGYEFVDDGSEVVQSGDGRDGWSAGRAKGSARDGHEQRRVYDLEGDPAVVERAGELAVATAQLPAGAGSASIEVEDPLDVERARGR